MYVFYLQTSESLETHDQSGQKLSRLHSPSKIRKATSSHAQDELTKSQAQRSKHSASQASLTRSQPKSSSSVLPNQSLASKFKKSPTSESTFKHSLSSQDAAKRLVSTKKQFLANKIEQKQPQKSTSKSQNLVHKSTQKLTLAKSEQLSPKTAVKKKKTAESGKKHSEVTMSTSKQTSSSPKTGQRSSDARATLKSTVKTLKGEALVATPALKQKASSRSTIRSHLVPKSKEPNSELLKNKTKTVSSKRSPPSNLPDSSSTSKRSAKSAAKKSQGCNSARSQPLAFKNKPRKMGPLHYVNQSPTYPKFLHAPECRLHKPCPVKSHPFQLQTNTLKSHKPISCQHGPKKQPSENSVQATTASHTETTTIFAHSTRTAVRGTNDTVTSIAQITPTADALTAALSPTTTTSASETITLSADTTAARQEATSLEGDTATAVTSTTAPTETSSGTMVEGTARGASASPTVTAMSTNTAPESTASVEVPTPTAAAPGSTTFTLGTTLPGIDAISVFPDDNTTARAVPEEDIPDPGEYVYNSDDYDPVPEYEYDQELVEDSTAIPAANATGPVTPSTPEATSPVQNAS